MKLIPYGEINIGEPDANAEYFISKKLNIQPNYIISYYDSDIPNFNQFLAGAKFLILGQKGTGKTAILRYIEYKSISEGYRTEFIVFKNTILRESELSHISSDRISSALIDESKLTGMRFYVHVIKRILLSVIISKMSNIEEMYDEEEGENNKLLRSILESRAADVVRSAYDSVQSLISASSLNVSEITKNRVTIDPIQFVKSSNDLLMNKISDKSKRDNLKVRIFLDEMHFSYRDPDQLSVDASLVRDTIIASQNINERFINDGVDITVFLGVRSEFIEQPEIGQADIIQTIESYGEQINWESFPVNDRHPIFDLVALRFLAFDGSRLNRDKLLKGYLSNIDIIELLQLTWCKPRDIIRYFKYCKSMYPKKIILTEREHGGVVRSYCSKSWAELKSAVSAFIPPGSIGVFEEIVKEIIPGQFDGSLKLSHGEFSERFKPLTASIEKTHKGINHDNLMDWMYKIGLYYYEYVDKNGITIYQQYHRGNRVPTKKGIVKIHAAIAKALG